MNLSPEQRARRAAILHAGRAKQLLWRLSDEAVKAGVASPLPPRVPIPDQRKNDDSAASKFFSEKARESEVGGNGSSGLSGSGGASEGSGVPQAGPGVGLKNEGPQIVYRRAKLYPAQSRCFFGSERWSWTEGTTKAGKTAGLIVWLSEQAILGKDGQNFWWVAPVAPVAAIAYRRMCKAIPVDLRTTHDTLQRITLINGAHIWFKSAEKPDNLYGEDVYAAAIDECSRVREDSWFAVRTTLSATKGKCRGIGNVKGRRNWFYKMCRRAEAKASADSSYHKLTWKDAASAGILDVQEVEDARAMLPPNVFQELYEAEASDDTGCPFGIEAIAQCVAPLSKNPAVVWGWDFARKRDWFVGIGLDYRGAVCAFERWQMPWQQAIPLCREKTNRMPALVDSTGVGDVILAALASGPGNFEGYMFTPRSKQTLMEALAVDIQMRKAQFPDGPIRNELESFEYEYRQNGQGVRYSAPEGMFDDCVCALALARWHWKAGHGSVGGLNGNGAGFARLPFAERSSIERGYGSRELLIG